LAVGACAVVALSAQTFEVASIRPSGPKSVIGSDGGPGSKSPERYTYGQATLRALILTAYDFQDFQISSKVPLDRDKFDLAVTIPPGTNREQFRAMLRNLLEDRFQLKAHTESREFPAYELVVGKNGPKLKDAGPDTPLPPEGFPQLPAGKPGMSASNTASNGYLIVRTTARQMPVSMLVRLFRRPGEPPVVDRTGLQGTYDFTLEYAQELANADTSAPPAPILATAIQQQLGLELVRKRLPFDVVAVDSVNRLPTEN
jgi:uncharacterized protein (TIGR03435 family)